MSQFKTRCLIILLFAVSNIVCFLNAKIASFQTPDSSSSQEGDDLAPTLPTVPTVIFSTAASSGLENSSSATLSLVLSATTTQNVVIPFSLSGTATQSVDFTLSATTPITIPAGQTTASISLTLLNDSTYEGPETIIFTLGTPQTNATLGSQETHIFTIIDDDPAPVSILVEKVYPTNGTNFLDYVANSDANKSRHAQNDVACVGTETGYYGCIHGGEKLKVRIPGYTSCTGLSASDLLGAFDWICEVVSGEATFFSTGLKHGKGLSDLIDFPMLVFLDNSVTVTNGVNTLGATTPSKWWTNTIQNLDVTPGVKNINGLTPGTLLVVGTSANTEGVNLSQSKVGLVIKSGQVLNYSGSASNCNWTDGTMSSPNWECVVAAGSQKYLWVEGELTTPTRMVLGLDIFSVTFSRFQNITINNTYGDTFYLLSSSNNIIKSLKMHTYKNRDYAFIWITGNDNLFSDVHIANETELNYASTLLLQGSRNVLNDIKTARSYGSLNIGGWEGGARDNIANNIQSIHSHVIKLGGANTPTTGNTLNHATVAYNYADCLSLLDTYVSYNTINQVLCSNTYTQIWIDNGPSHNTLSQIATDTNNGIPTAISMYSSSNNKFTNNMLIAGSSLACDVSGGTNPGLTSGCVNQGASDATWTLLGTTNLYPSMIGLLSTNDTANSSDTGAPAAYGAINDWLNFDNIFRGWSTSNLNDTSQCISGSCQIIDTRLNSTDTYILNKSGNGVSSNDPFVAGAACPSAIHGNKALTDSATSPRTFLINATEIMDDDIGNDNGLCESYEACIYSPNFGAYQGQGNYKTNGTCTFQNGTVTNVIMYSYPTNGI
tara:strand:- start:22282 stop:24777 length:2496 start_codon:yes stop_codon:yes gene_type:complete